MEITRLERDENGRVLSLRVSMKAAEERKQVPITVYGNYTGVVTGISQTAYYVRMNGLPKDVRCPLNANRAYGIAHGDHVKFFVTGIYDDVVVGSITSIMKRPKALF